MTTRTPLNVLCDGLDLVRRDPAAEENVVAAYAWLYALQVEHEMVRLFLADSDDPDRLEALRAANQETGKRYR